MNGLMGLGLWGWLLALAGGFVFGGIFFLSIKLLNGACFPRSRSAIA